MYSSIVLNYNFEVAVLTRGIFTLLFSQGNTVLFNPLQVNTCKDGRWEWTKEVDLQVQQILVAEVMHNLTPLSLSQYTDLPQ